MQNLLSIMKVLVMPWVAILVSPNDCRKNITDKSAILTCFPGGMVMMAWGSMISYSASRIPSAYLAAISQMQNGSFLANSVIQPGGRQIGLLYMPMC